MRKNDVLESIAAPLRGAQRGLLARVVFGQVTRLHLRSTGSATRAGVARVSGPVPGRSRGGTRPRTVREACQRRRRLVRPACSSAAEKRQLDPRTHRTETRGRGRSRCTLRSGLL